MVQGYTQENSGSASGWQAHPTGRTYIKSVRCGEWTERELLINTLNF